MAARAFAFLCARWRQWLHCGYEPDHRRLDTVINGRMMRMACECGEAFWERVS